MTEHKNWIIEHNPKPIPDRRYDYDAYHEDYDGAPDSGDSRSFCCPSIKEAKAEIDDWIQENNLHQNTYEDLD